MRRHGNSWRDTVHRSGREVLCETSSPNRHGAGCCAPTDRSPKPPGTHRYRGTAGGHNSITALPAAVSPAPENSRPPEHLCLSASIWLRNRLLLVRLPPCGRLWFLYLPEETRAGPTVSQPGPFACRRVLPCPPAVQSLYYCTFTSISRGFTSSRLGTVTWSTPFRYSAPTFSPSASFGRLKLRWKLP
jgi:hypothetical protein